MPEDNRKYIWRLSVLLTIVSTSFVSLGVMKLIGFDESSFLVKTGLVVFSVSLWSAFNIVVFREVRSRLRRIIIPTLVLLQIFIGVALLIIIFRMSRH